MGIINSYTQLTSSLTNILNNSTLKMIETVHVTSNAKHAPRDIDMRLSYAQTQSLKSLYNLLAITIGSLEWNLCQSFLVAKPSMSTCLSLISFYPISVQLRSCSSHGCWTISSTTSSQMHHFLIGASTYFLVGSLACFFRGSLSSS
jgi:hypothetical protein